MWSPSTKPFLFLHYFGFCFNRFAPIFFRKIVFENKITSDSEACIFPPTASSHVIASNVIELIELSRLFDRSCTKFGDGGIFNLLLKAITQPGYCSVWLSVKSGATFSSNENIKKAHILSLLHANIFFPHFDENRWLVLKLLFLFFRALWSWQIRIMIGW